MTSFSAGVWSSGLVLRGALHMWHSELRHRVQNQTSNVDRGCL